MLLPVLLAACTTATPYQPAVANKPASGGYADTRIDTNRYRVSFSGNTMTSREVVETYLLYRAAELTKQDGYSWFSVADRNTDKQSSTSVDRSLSGYGGYGGYGLWGPSWRFYGGSYGWRDWDPTFGGPFGGSNFDINTVNRFEASAEVVMFKGPKPANDPNSYDATQVLANLQSKIVVPK